jgi:hypothetical protein
MARRNCSYEKYFVDFMTANSDKCFCLFKKGFLIMNQSNHPVFFVPSKK